MRFVLLGPPASGKGTQGRLLAENLGLRYLSTGALLRENVENGTELGKLAKPILDRGGYLPDDLMSPILGAWLETNSPETGWLLDGFPRSVPQAIFLDQWLAENGSKLDAAIALDVPFEELLERTHNRVECPSCRWTGQRGDLKPDSACPKCGAVAGPRADDDEANFRNRYAEFNRLTLPVIEYYRERGTLHSVSATPPKEQVAQTIFQEVSKLSASV